jgi:hypothetical protein
LSRQESNHLPILVTGAHRSGTTWVGKMLSASKGAAYISEPLNVHHRPGVMSSPVEHWYTYICTDNENEYLSALSETLTYRYHIGNEIKSLRSAKDLLRMVRDWSNFQVGRIRHQRPLLKDPFAIFSAPWFADRLGCKVVLTVRHPAAVASSLKRLNWSFDFRDLTSQTYLMRDWLEPYRADMEIIPADDVIGQSCLLWSMIYQVVDIYRNRFPNFHVVRHEDLSVDPVGGYRALYASLGLQFTSAAQKIIIRSSSSQNPPEISTRSVHATKIDSRSSLSNWKRRLTSDEIARIRLLTGDAARLFYQEKDWE